MENFPKFTAWDAAKWKFLPEKMGGGGPYLTAFKTAWIRHNKLAIKAAAGKHGIPDLLLAGIAWVEVGGKDFTDYPVYYVRSFDWSGPHWTDTQTITKHPSFTSMGAVSIQLRRAAQTLGLKPERMTARQLDKIAEVLQTDVANLNIVARHLSQLIRIDIPALKGARSLTDEQIRIAGTRYFYGPDLTKEDIIKKSRQVSSYGNAILRHKATIEQLLQ